MRSLQLAIIAAGGLLTACVADAPDESSMGQSVETHNRLAGNRLAGNRLAGNRLAGNHLASVRLSDTRFVLDGDAASLLLATEEGRDVLSYIVSCAVPEGVVLTVENPPDGSPSEYFGALGLAPQWLSAPLDGVGKGWVSACLFARVNANAEAVSISLRGSNSALSVSPEEEAEYTLQEGAFYGNYFTPIDQPIEWFSCRGHDQAAGEIGALVDRDCAEASPTDPNVSVCGFNFEGDCFGVNAACKTENNGQYTWCDTATAPRTKKGLHHPITGKDASRQVITVYVTAN